MNYSRNHRSVTVNLREIEITCVGVTFYPACAANDTDPPEPPFVEWDSVRIGGVEVVELFHGELGEELEDALVGQLEYA